MWLAEGALSGTKFTSMSSQVKINFSSYNVFIWGVLSDDTTPRNWFLVRAVRLH